MQSAANNKKFDQSYDELNLANEKFIKSSLSEDEHVTFSTLVTKINDQNKKQERVILITNKNLYNIKLVSPLNNILVKIFNSAIIRRKININKIIGVTISRVGFEFVIHVENEYDYRFLSLEKRDKIIEVLSNCYQKLKNNTSLKIYYKDDSNLFQYTTSKVDFKNGISRKPEEKSLLMDCTSLDKSASMWLKKNFDAQMMQKSLNLYSNSKEKVSLSDFNLISVLGKGAFGKVMLVEKKDTTQLFAMKSLRKEEIIEKNQVEHTKTERRILEYAHHPFLVKLEYAFQTPDKIFLVMHFIRGGELYLHLKAARRFSEERAKFYAAEIALALEYLHQKDIIYRDLKPENILLDDDGHICLTDFGLSKYVGNSIQATTIVGTPEYLAPEIISGHSHGKPADLWSFGILVYEMLYGTPPFYHQNQMTMFQLIKSCDLRFPSQVTVSGEAKDLIKKLLVKHPENRLGAKSDVDEVKSHPWFKNVDWEGLLNKKIKPPFKPKISDKYCVDNFDEEFTREEPINSFVTTTKMNLVNQHQSDFDDFSYAPKNGLIKEEDDNC